MISGRFSQGTGRGVGVSPFPSCTLASQRSCHFCHERTSTRHLWGQTQAGLRGSRPPAPWGPAGRRGGKRCGLPWELPGPPGWIGSAADRAGGVGSRWTRRRTARGPPVPSRWRETISAAGAGRGEQPGSGGDPAFHDNAEAARTKAPQSAFYWFELIICSGWGWAGPGNSLVGRGGRFGRD